MFGSRIKDVSVGFPDNNAEGVIDFEALLPTCQRNGTYRAPELGIPPKADLSPPKVNAEDIGESTRRDDVRPHLGC